MSSLNRQSLGEEIANAVSHGIGALLAVLGTVVLIVYASYNSSVSGIVSAAIYGFCLIFLYLMSTIYHAITNSTAKKIFQVLDHCSIFLLILGSYVPICIVLLPPELGWKLLGINLLLTVVGITLNAISLSRWEKLSLLKLTDGRFSGIFGGDISSEVEKKRALQSIVCGVVIGMICGFIGAGGGMMMLLILTSVLGYELKTAVGTSVFIMTFTALTGAASHFAIGGAPDWTVFILCVLFTLLWARIAAVFASKADAKTLNRATGIVLVVLGIVVMGFNLLTK